MKKLIFTRPDGGISVVIPNSKEKIERILGKLTDEQYKAHIKSSIPKDATNIREVDDADIPASREFRDAWVDVTAEPKIDICCKKARDIQLTKLRSDRNKKLEKLDKDFLLALEKDDAANIAEVKQKKQALRDLTEPLKAMEVEGKVNDDNILNEIRLKGKLEDNQ
jgi:hypothetical protein